MSWSAPKTWVVGEVAKAADFNTYVRDEFLAVSRAYTKKTTAQTVNNTTTETDLLNGEFTIAASTLGTTGVLRLTAWGDYLNDASSSPPPVFSVKLGSSPTLVLKTPTMGLSFPASATRQAWRFIVEIANLGGAASQLCVLDGAVSVFNNSGSGTASAAMASGEGSGVCVYTAAGGQERFVGFATSSIDTTSDMAVELTVINGTASANYETKLYGAVLEIIP